MKMNTDNTEIKRRSTFAILFYINRIVFVVKIGCAGIIHPNNSGFSLIICV